MQLRDSILDQYNIRARLYPVLFLVAPAVTFTTLVIPEADRNTLWGLTIFIFPTIYLLITIVRNQGYQLEEKIFDSRDKIPTHRAIDDEEYRTGIHIKSGTIQHLPKDLTTNAKVRYLKNRTRNHQEFPVVFDTLCTYGFYRNTYAIKWWSLVLLGIYIFFFLTANCYGWKLTISQTAVAVFLCTTTVVNALLFLFVRRRNVVKMGENYARALLRTCAKICG